MLDLFTDTSIANTTKLVWADVEHAGSFKDAIMAFDNFIQQKILTQHASFSFVSLGTWDLRVRIAREAREKAHILPDYIQYPRLYDLTSEYSQWANLYADSLSTPHSLSSICSALDIKPSSTEEVSSYQEDQNLLPSPGARRAIEQCATMHKILRALVKRYDGADKRLKLFQRPLDSKADIASFLQESSKVLHLSGLASDTTQSELESWFTSFGGRPVAFWTLRTPDLHKPTGTGFAIFATHDEAVENLNMNGRALGDRTIEVLPSSSRILDRASEILTPFPVGIRPPVLSELTYRSPVRTGPDRVTGHALRADSLIFKEEQLVSDVSLLFLLAFLYADICSGTYPSSGTLDPGPFYQSPLVPGMGALPGYPSQTSQHSTNLNSVLRNSGNGHVPFRAGDWCKDFTDCVDINELS